MTPLTPIQIAAIHHGLVLLVIRSRERIDALVTSGNGNTEIAEYWRSQLADAQQALEAMGLGSR
jgi:hypothetical protein